MTTLLQHARMLPRAYAAYRAGVRARIPGLDLDRFGRRVGLEMLARREPLGGAYLLHPVDIVRYFEFDLALSALPRTAGEFLDVSSPRLFSMFVARREPTARITVINPDASDADLTRRMARALRLPNVDVRPIAIEALEEGRPIDCAWSLSVVEHIGDEPGDSAAIANLHRRLAPGGILVVSVPSAREFRTEYRDEDVYGTEPGRKDGRYFFQRVYDERAIRARLVAAAPWRDVQLRWFGETTPGWFTAYERRWAAEGLPFVVDDPRFIAAHFREYGDWSEMPGDGVCGLVLRK
jgi:SAM-dependent methyltransferase